jgi:ribosomal protein S21
VRSEIQETGGGALPLARESDDRRGGDSRREGYSPAREFEREVRKLKKDFQRNVLPAVKRHSSYVSKSEMRRIKERKAARRRRRQLRKLDELQ